MANSDIVEDMEVVLRIALSQVAPDAALTSKRMFGGAGFFAYGKIFAAWFGTDRLAIKLSEDDREELLEIDDTGPSMMTAYIEVPEAWMTDPDALALWVERSLEFSVGPAK
ncbi:MAG: TfoX/Sxy family protein [Anaerolineae bacterium]|nr:TfoX/Sxy family protein [Anaerolineae bacterium]MCB9460232.1 TfoX/Sxy family protein [Anaerolineaceae bacterium]